MIYILLSILCSVLIANLLLLFGRDKGTDILLVFVGNYFVASGVSLAGVKLTPASMISLPELAFAVLAGFLFLANFYVYHRNIGENGMSLSVGVMRGAVIIPTIFSAIAFADRPGIMGVIGIAVLLLAFGLLTGKQRLRNLIWIVLLFLVTGMTDVSLKVFSALGKSPQSLFLYFLFSSAFVLTLIWYLSGGARAPLRNLAYGFVIGIPNQLSSLFFLKGLSVVPASLAFPLVSSGIVTLSILTDAIIWRKRFSRVHLIALALLVAGIVLINLR